MRKAWMFILIIGLCFLTSGCAVYMAANQPGNKNLDLLKVGMPRDSIMAEFGAPINTDTKDGKKVDVYRFRQGYSQGEKAVRAVGHGTADVFTLGLWEVIGTPAEATFNGKDMAVKVAYDKDDKVENVTYLTQK